MISTNRLSILIGLLLGWETAGLACVDLGEEVEIASSDAVIDGLAICSMERGRCRLRAREVVKEDDRRRTSSQFYTLRFEPGANERLFREMEETGTLIMCVNPWEPRSTRVEGRFYLIRAGGAYRARQRSARGDRDFDVVEEDEGD